MTPDAPHPDPRCRECGKVMELDRGICQACLDANQPGPTPPDHPLWGLLDPMRKSLIIVATLALVTPAVADDQPNLSKDVAACLVQARAALGPVAKEFDGRSPAEQIDAYASQGKIYFNNPFVSQNPTFAFWKCLRLKGYNIPG